MASVKVDQCLPENRRAHHTNEYEDSELIIRRGQAFTFKVSTASKDVTLHFKTGKNPNRMAGTHLEASLGSTQASGESLVKSCSSAAGCYTVELEFPVDCVVGRYQISVEASGRTERVGNCCVLFNPWCSADEAYMENESHRNEYILEEDGLQFQGNSRQIRMKRWFFGQFEKGVLSAVLDLLDNDAYYSYDSDKYIHARRSAIHVTRSLSALVNCQDDDGVLVGNWSGDYKGGVEPWKWNGSADILRQWAKSGPVQFGQCWVFSGVLTTTLRAIGIPARSVTNFESAHDTDKSITIDTFFDASGKHMDTSHPNHPCNKELQGKAGSDSCWNFHVWNEAWMSRADLEYDSGKNNNGWQACDSTPQESSNGLMRCGPVPVQAIKEGRIYVEYDADFVYAEVNSDKCQWQETRGSSDFDLVSRNRAACGKHISTKAIGILDREDVTCNYKFPEGSAEEKLSFDTAYNHGAKPKYQLGDITKADIKREFSVNLVFPDDNKVIGDDLELEVHCKNEAELVVKNVPMMVTVSSTNYKHSEKKTVAVAELTEDHIAPNGTAVQKMRIPYEEYAKFITQKNIFEVEAMVKLDGKIYNDVAPYELDAPADHIDLEVAKEIRHGAATALNMTVRNPLKVDMTNISVTVDGRGIASRTLNFTGAKIPVGGSHQFTVNFQPTRVGKATLNVDVDSDQVQNILDCIRFDVVA